jgi:branched-chain amino acid transport system substrate-binding protein
VAGCAGQTNTTATVGGSTLSIYAGQPPGGSGSPQAQDVLDAERLALQQSGSQVGRFRINFVLADSSKTSDNARRAINDSSTIAYLGEISPPHQSADSLGITNGVDVLQVSPTDTAIDLTQPTRAVPGSPTKWYESLSANGRTFARVVPSDTLQARAQAQEMAKLGVHKLYVAHDKSLYGAAIALAVSTEAGKAGITVSTSDSGADAIFYGGTDAAGAARLFNAAAPGVKLFAVGGIDGATLAGMLSPVAERNIYLSAPGFTSQALNQAGKKFVADFQTSYHRVPQASAIFGYEAMASVLDALRRANTAANTRASVVKEFFKNTQNRSSVLGTYSINGDGDTNLGPFVFSRFNKAGKLVPSEFKLLTG